MLLKPIVPVAQNLQPILHPTCDDTHSVERTPPGRGFPSYFPSRVSYRMTTASTDSPFWRRMSNLVVVRSLDSAAAVSVDVVGRNLFRRRAYAAAGSDGTPSRSPHLGFCSTYLIHRCRNSYCFVTDTSLQKEEENILNPAMSSMDPT